MIQPRQSVAAEGPLTSAPSDLQRPPKTASCIGGLDTVVSDEEAPVANLRVQRTTPSRRSVGVATQLDVRVSNSPRFCRATFCSTVSSAIPKAVARSMAEVLAAQRRCRCNRPFLILSAVLGYGITGPNLGVGYRPWLIPSAPTLLLFAALACYTSRHPRLIPESEVPERAARRGSTGVVARVNPSSRAAGSTPARFPVAWSAGGLGSVRYAV